uniref:Uncharacterized protein n=1 Tax=Solanum lycopersicum TaxID=4081 RepID=A0A3Q7IL61_SOLLC
MLIWRITDLSILTRIRRSRMLILRISIIIQKVWLKRIQRVHLRDSQRWYEWNLRRQNGVLKLLSRQSKFIIV